MNARRQILQKCSEIGSKLPPFLIARIDRELRGSGLPLKPQEVAGLGVCLAVGGAFCGLLVSGSVVGGLVLGVLGFAAPAAACRAAVSFRGGKVARQLEAAAEPWAVQVRDGKLFFAVLTEAVTRGEGPLREELAVVLAEYRLGLPLIEAWSRLAVRVRTSEVVQIVEVFRAHLETGTDPLEPLRLINFRQPFEMPELPKRPAPRTFEDAVHLLHLAVLEVLDPRELILSRPQGDFAKLFAERGRALLEAGRLPAELASEQEALLQALADEVEGRGPLEALMRREATQAVYVLSPQDVFAATLPAELVDNLPREGAPATPEGYQRARTRFRDTVHLLRVLERMLEPLGATLSNAHPNVEGVLPGGWEVAAQLTAEGTPAIALGRSASA